MPLQVGIWLTTSISIALTKRNVPSKRLLILNLAAHGFGWEQLCSFLGLDIPATPYPHINSTEGFVKLISTAWINPAHKRALLKLAAMKDYDEEVDWKTITGVESLKL